MNAAALDTQNEEILCFTADESEKNLFVSICQSFKYKINCINNIDTLLEMNDQPRAVIISENNIPNEASLDEVVQTAHQQFPNATLFTFVNKELSTQRFDFLEKLGVRFIMLKKEIDSGKFLFLLNQTLQFPFIAIKAADLVSDKVIPFDLYHCLNIKKHFLVINKAGTALTKERLTRLSQQSDYFIQKKEIAAYNQFVVDSTDLSAKGIARRCRANFLNLQIEFQNLIVELTNETNRVSFKEGAELLERCYKLCDEFIANLAEFKNPWEIMNLSEIGQFGSVSRAPAVAGFSGIFSLMCGLKNISRIMLAALIVDLSQLKLNSKISIKLIHHAPLNQEETESIHRIPHQSLNLVLDRKLAIDEKTRSLLDLIYENADGTGYPAGVDLNKLNLESQMIRFSKEFDQRISFDLGEKRQKPEEVLKSLFDQPELKSVFTEDFKKTVAENIYANF